MVMMNNKCNNDNEYNIIEEPSLKIAGNSTFFRTG